jgi:murein DD-endopeptidase
MVLACAALAFSACASGPTDAVRIEIRPFAMVARPASLRPRALRRAGDSSVAARAAATAQSMLGTPYRWGGESPAGFDCSGLVHYAYGKAGASVPRTSGELFRTSQPVPIEEARAGDLVFFRLAGKVSHVGIYLDDGRFVHAPSTGKRVEVASLDRGWYERNFIRAGRL